MSGPRHLYGKPRSDRLIQALELAATGYFRATAVLARRPELPVVRDRTLVVVKAREVVAVDQNVVSLTFTAPDGGELPAWRPGAHLDLELPSGIVRQYSLCGDPGDRHAYRIAVRRIPDGVGSAEVHDALQVGRRLVVRGPRNGFGFAVPGFGSPSGRLRFIAGGIGITPILPMVRLAHALGLDWSLCYTGRSRESLPFLDELAGFGDRVTLHLDDESGLPTAAGLLGGAGPGTAIYCCGPTPMLNVALAALRGVRDVEFHFERFSAPPIVDGTEFEIELARSGERLTIPADRSVLDVLRERRPDTPYSCRQGFCRTCTVRVLSGTPDHRETALTAQERENGDFLICVSRAETPTLVLDV